MKISYMGIPGIVGAITSLEQSGLKQPQVTLTVIRDVVCEQYECTIERFHDRKSSGARTGNLPLLVQTFCYIAHLETKRVISSVGVAAFISPPTHYRKYRNKSKCIAQKEPRGGYDHATVLYSVKALEDKLDTGIVTKLEIKQLVEKILLKLNS